MLENTYSVNLTKKQSGLGFSIHTDPSYSVTRIKRIFPHGPAAHSGGQLREGDVILQVNDQKVKGLSHEEVMVILHTASSRVSLVMCHPPEDVLPALPLPSKASGDSTGTRSPISPPSLLTTTAEISHHNQPSQSEEEEGEGVIATPDDVIDSSTTASRTITAASLEDDTAPDRPTEEHHSDLATDSPRSSSVPTPVRSFMADAGLESPPQSPPPSVTPSSEKMQNYSGTDRSQSPSLQSDTSTVKAASEAESALQPGEYEVTLTKGAKGLGFTVAGGQNIGYFFVKEVLYEPALSQGNIRSGDRLIVVNGVDMREMEHKEAVTYLRQTPQTVSLRFYRPQQHERVPTPKKESDSVSEAQSEDRSEYFSEDRSEDQDEDHDEASASEEESHEAVSSPSVRSLIKAMEGKKSLIKPREYGKGKTSGATSDSEEEGAAPDTKGAAGLNESLASTGSSWGDITLPMPGEGMPDNKKPLNASTSRRDSLPESGVIRVELDKPESGSLGFSLIQGEKGLSSALFVRSINPGGAADKEGRLRVGDRLLQVNSVSVIGMPHNKAVALIKKARGTVTLAVSRASSHSTSAATTPRHTPSREVDTETDESPVHTPRTNYNTDSDLDSAIQEAADMTRSRKDQYEAQNRRNATLSKDGELSKQQQQQQPQDSEASSTTSSKKAVPAKPPRKGSLTRLPSNISDEWLRSLPLVSPPADSLHYSGRQLQTCVKQLRNKIERDDPVEEHKGLKYAKLTDMCAEARKPENKPRNKYRNVLPYDANRVRLEGPQSYINASTIRYTVGKDRLHYIACQEPLPQTVNDFWRMVWQEKAEVIAMITQGTKTGKADNHYWPPSLKETMMFADRYEVSLTQQQKLKHFDIHSIKMEDTQTGRVHRLTHLNLHSWPDLSSQCSVAPLLQYIRFIHVAQHSGPIVVHCSAGIGRTGTIMTLDIMLSLIDRDLKFDVQKIVMDLRRQRQGMIQTKDQYILCYKACLEALESLQK